MILEKIKIKKGSIQKGIPPNSHLEYILFECLKSREDITMSVYVIIGYFEECRKKHQEPTLEGLKNSKKAWRD